MNEQRRMEVTAQVAMAHDLIVGLTAALLDALSTAEAERDRLRALIFAYNRAPAGSDEEYTAIVALEAEGIGAREA